MQLLFDLDGTLSDSSPGIIRCVVHTMRVLGQDVPSIPRLRGCLGPPLLTIFQSLLPDCHNDVIERAIAIYREEYEAAGISETALFYARRVVKQLGIASFFNAVFAPTLDDRVTTKSTLVRAAVTGRTHDASEMAMIGDRAEDIIAARENRIFSAAAAWGYGTSEEIAEAKPDRIFHTMTEYVHWIESGDSAIVCLD